jgi:hypothetical protein
VKVFDLEAGTGIAKASRPDDCIGCLSCVYACPSGCLEVSGVEVLPTLHRVEEHAAFVEKFLQVKQAEQAPISPEEWEEARKDVSRCLMGLADSIQETIGRGFKMLGRDAGALATAHLPEMYEEPGSRRSRGRCSAGSATPTTSTALLPPPPERIEGTRVRLRSRGGAGGRSGGRCPAGGRRASGSRR